METRRLAAWLLCACGLTSTAFGQVATQYNTTVLAGAGPIYKKQDSLEPFFANLYGIPVPKNTSDPDVSITLEPLNGGVAADVGVFCNPGWGTYADINANYPQPGYSVWQSDLQSGVDTLFISKNDKLYRPPSARLQNTTAYKNFQPYFICSVINLEPNKVVSYRLEAALISNSGSLKPYEQKALGNIYQKCCASGEGNVCPDWKAQNARKGYLVLDFCTFPGQICTANGTLLRLDFRNQNLQCPFPAGDMAIFTSLTSLNLGHNPNLTGSITDVFDSLANARSLKYLNLFKDRGLTGTFMPDNVGPSMAGVCQLTRRSLLTLNADGVGLNGTLPSCLLSNSSKLVELHLGNNLLTGTIPDTLTANSKLQILTLYRNQLSGPLPPSLGKAPQLTNLDVSNNTLNGTIPAQLGDCPSLKFAILRGNNFTGSLPSALATAPTLETLDVKMNQLTALPTEWVRGWPGVVNSSLVNVRTSFNQLSGPFPAALGRAPQLSYLIINNNTLSGPLPRGPNIFQGLRALNASNNQFNGSIPETLGSIGIFTLKPLQFEDGAILSHVFDLSNNAFSGPIPSFLDMTSVQQVAQKSIYLAGNNLTYTCNAQHMYIRDLCGGKALAPSQSPLIGGGQLGGSGAPTDATQIGTMSPAGGPDNSQPMFPVNPVQAAGQPVDSTLPNNANQKTETTASRGGLPLGAIIGLVVAGVLLAILLAVLVVFLLICRKRKGGAPPPAPVAANTQPEKKSGLQMMGSKLSSVIPGKGSGFTKFHDGVEMSENKGMQGFGSHTAAV